MRKGQGSLEYLLILAAILAIAVVVVVVANSMLSAPEQQTKLQQDRYACSLQNIELVNYNELYTGTQTLNVKYSGEDAVSAGTAPSAIASCQIGLKSDNSKYTLSVNQSGTDHFYALE